MQFSMGYNGWYWLGGYDFGHEGTWKWIHSELPVNYTAGWYPGEPNGGTRENCAEFKTAPSDGHRAWNDGPCEGRRHPLCKAPFELWENDYDY